MRCHPQKNYLQEARVGSASNAAVEERPFRHLSIIRGRADREREAAPRQAPLYETSFFTFSMMCRALMP